MSIYWKNVLRNWDALLIKKLISFVFTLSRKDRFSLTSLNKLSESNVVYQFSCPGCESSYTGKTQRTLFERTKEHGTRADSPIKGHLDNWLNMEHLFSIKSLILNDVNTHEFRLNLVCQNTIKIDESNNWNFYHLKKNTISKRNVQFWIMGSKRLEQCYSFECNLAIIYIQSCFNCFLLFW